MIFGQLSAICPGVSASTSAIKAVTADGDDGAVVPDWKILDFISPNLRWMSRAEPEIFRHIRQALLPKDFIRLELTGAIAGDISAAAGLVRNHSADT